MNHLIIKAVAVLISSATFLFSAPAFSITQIYGECFDCSEYSAQAVANTLATNSENYSLLHIHIADIHRRLIYSYKSIDRDGTRSLSVIATPTPINTKMTDLRESYSKLVEDTKSIIIPTSVMSSAWEWTNCSYCRNNITDFISGTLQGRVMTVGQTINRLAETFGLVKTSIANQFTIPLEEGGKIVIKLDVDAELSLYIEVIDVVDENNNSVPFEPAKLKNLRIRVSDASNVEAINSFIISFNFYVPRFTIGKVTITDIP